ncbi:MAG TPA: bifunctional DNA primase/polymerase [Rhodanobacteraceae bacterium]|nr:bifunctional DNA primase/polymerase [Rhodanobacteraceae bacterium]
MNAVARIAAGYADTLRDYIRAGLVLVPIPAGSKAPHGKGWNRRASCWTKPDHVPDGYTGNVGLAHAYSGTCALDIDNATLAAPALHAHGIDLAALLAAPDAVHVRSGREGRDKLLYRLPDGVTLASVNRSAAEGFELRCAASNGRTVQDVLPPSIHPDTSKPYQWAGDWRAIPNAPADLVMAWRGMLDAGTAPRTLPQPTRTRRTLAKAIPEGERNAKLFSLARGFVQRGHDAQAVNDRLQRINAERCTPPLGADEVDAIAAQAIGYGSDGFAVLTHKLLDARELNALPLPSRWIIVTWFRRYDGTSAGIALTHADCRTIPGCADEKDFIRYRALAVASGILQCKRKGSMTRDGRTPNLYAINPQFQRSHTGQVARYAHTGQFPRSYIDKQ